MRPSGPVRSEGILRSVQFSFWAQSQPSDVRASRGWTRDEPSERCSGGHAGCAAPGRLGTLERGSIHGPGFRPVDPTISKAVI